MNTNNQDMKSALADTAKGIILLILAVAVGIAGVVGGYYMIKTAISGIKPPALAEGRYSVRLEKICLAELDWAKDSAGRPRDVRITVYKNGNPVYNRLFTGDRGERQPQSDCSFEIDHTKDANYQIKLEEEVIIVRASWSPPRGLERIHPKKPVPGYWPFDGQKISVTDNTWLVFSCTKVR